MKMRYVLVEGNYIFDLWNSDRQYFIGDNHNGKNRLLHEMDDLGEVIKTSNDIFDLVGDGDLILNNDNNIYFTVESVDTKNERIYYFISECNTDVCSFSDVESIMKKQEKNYICVWEREEVK